MCHWMFNGEHPIHLAFEISRFRLFRNVSRQISECLLGLNRGTAYTLMVNNIQAYWLGYTKVDIKGGNCLVLFIGLYCTSDRTSNVPVPFAANITLCGTLQELWTCQLLYVQAVKCKRM